MNSTSFIIKEFRLALLTGWWRLLAFPRLLKSYLGDAIRFAKHSATFSFKKHPKLIGRIVRYYHSLEKGLSLRDVKPVFGEPIALRLLRLVKIAEKEGLGENVQVKAARAVLREWGQHVGSDTSLKIAGLPELIAREDKARSANGGVVSATRQSLLHLASGPFCDLLKARRSIRWFDERLVEENLLVRAIEMAQQSPSVCNRQAGRAIYTTDSAKIQAALALQDGNRGFGATVKALFIVTADLSVFGGPDERNQVFVDGGLFAMTLMYALSSLGLGACPLNWMADPKRDAKLRRLACISESQVVIMLLAVGHMPEQVKIARSCRNDLGEVATRW